MDRPRIQDRKWCWKKVNIKKLTPLQRRQRLADSLKHQKLDNNELEEEYCQSIFCLEKELGHYIDDDYPITKFLEEMKQLNKFKEKEKQANEGI